MKTVTLKIPTREDIAPAARDAGTALVGTATHVPALGLTLVTGGISLFTHVMSEGATVLKAGGKKLAIIYKEQRIKKAIAIIEAARDEEADNSNENAMLNQL